MRFPYTRRDTAKPIFSLGNVTYRLRPMLTVRVVGTDNRSQPYLATLDSGADDTVFPASVARDLHVDLTIAEPHGCKVVGGHDLQYRYGKVELRLEDNDNEIFIWDAIVGFGETVNRAVLGHAGVMQYFDVEFLGESKQIVINPSPSFPGRREVRKAP